MPICIYCTNDTQKGREHVVPRCMGIFVKPNNLTIVGGHVCNECNSKVFNPLETKFKEDSDDGIFCQMLNLERSCEIRISGKNVRMDLSPGFGNDFFKEIFPILRWEDGSLKLHIEPQIKIKRDTPGSYVVLLVNELRRLRANGHKKIERIKKFLASVPSKKFQVFAPAKDSGDDSLLVESINLLRELGGKYNEGSRQENFDERKQEDRVFEIKSEVTLGLETGRVIAKVAFNYFAYCAIQDGRADILMHQNFSKIKSYILGKHDIPIKEVITNLNKSPLLNEESVAGKRLFAHVILFSQEKDEIIAKLSFFGKMVYTINLGKIPCDLVHDNFGSGHFFDVGRKTIFQLTQNLEKKGQDVPVKFSLFNRV